MITRTIIIIIFIYLAWHNWQIMKYKIIQNYWDRYSPNTGLDTGTTADRAQGLEGLKILGTTTDRTQTGHRPCCWDLLRQTSVDLRCRSVDHRHWHATACLSSLRPGHRGPTHVYSRVAGGACGTHSAPGWVRACRAPGGVGAAAQLCHYAPHRQL